jgi:hypothetical protein
MGRTLARIALVSCFCFGSLAWAEKARVEVEAPPSKSIFTETSWGLSGKDAEELKNDCRTLQVADLDGDGDADVIFQPNRDLYWIENANGQGTKGVVHEIPQFSAEEFLVADMDDNKTPDIVTTTHQLQVWWNGGKAKKWKATTVHERENVYKRLNLADMNGDKRLDIVVSDQGMIWFENKGKGKFGDAQVMHASCKNGTPGDFNGDGKMDAFAFCEGEPALLTHAGKEWKFTKIEVPSEISWSDYLVTDGDGDGDLDIFNKPSTYDGKTIVYMVQNNGGAFTAKAVFGISSAGLDTEKGGTAAELFGIRAGDFDGDGKNDILIIGRGGSRALGWFKNVSGEWKMNQIVEGSWGGKADVGDINGDGKLDVVATDGYSRGLTFWKNGKGGGAKKKK